MLLFDVIKYVRKISFTMYFVGSVLFFSIIGLVPLFGYVLSVSEERIKKGSNSNPPSFNSIIYLTGKGIIGLFIIVLTLIPSGLIYVTMPFLIEIIDIDSSLFLTILLLIVTIVGIIFSFIGLYLFSAILFAYSRYSVDDNLSFTNSILYTLFQVCLSKKYLYVFGYIVVLSLIFGLVIELLFISVILAPLASIVALIYFTSLGYIIGSLTTEFRIGQELPGNAIYVRKLLKNYK